MARSASCRVQLPLCCFYSSTGYRAIEACWVCSRTCAPFRVQWPPLSAAHSPHWRSECRWGSRHLPNRPALDGQELRLDVQVDIARFLQGSTIFWDLSIWIIILNRTSPTAFHLSQGDHNHKRGVDVVTWEVHTPVFYLRETLPLQWKRFIHCLWLEERSFSPVSGFFG